LRPFAHRNCGQIANSPQIAIYQQTRHAVVR
jgi:hypothetical protein